ncbi:MAG: site-2 protease family protein [Pedosphaera sp.]|nr:site-2 protease family protein [Pedosphaera sp.]
MSCFLIVVVIWVFSVCLHEYGHAIVAYHGGDHTVEEKGYLSMNPVYYAHPVTSFLLPMLFMIAGGIGLPGGAVYIDRHLLRSRGWETAVSMAGPAMNLILALIITAALKFYLIPYYPTHIATEALAFALVLQISAVLFNLIPIPPLDGFQAIEPWLSQQWREHLLPMSNYGFFILFILFQSVDALNDGFWFCVRNVLYFLGVPPHFAGAGFHAFQFWKQ